MTTKLNDITISTRNGRRLRHAVARVQEEVDKLRIAAGNLVLEECEGDNDLFVEVKTMLLACAELLVLRHKYLSVAPWNFCNADTRNGARAFLESATGRPLAEQDELTRYFLEKYRVALERLAHGDEDEECDPGLAYEVGVVNDTPLDESAGEGYHRSTHHTKIRASHSKSVYIKQSTRFKQNLALLKRFLRLGPAGKRVLRFEWRHWKRILQTNKRRLWVNKGRFNKTAVFQRVYRMDPKAEESWSSICTRLLAPGQGEQSDTLDAPRPRGEQQMQAMRIEYLQCVLVPQRWYRVEVPVAGMDDEGRPTSGTEQKHFLLLGTAGGRSRPKLMPTIESYRDLVVTGKLALNIQELAVKPTECIDEGSVVVFEDANARWVSWDELAPWPQLFRALSHFLDNKALNDQPGCVQLSGRELTKPTYAITDKRCPTLTVMYALHDMGWRPSGGRVVHGSAAIGDMDAREATKMKSYFIVLVEIDRCLLLTSQIPSDEPIAFYDCLLEGLRVEPGLGNAHYLALKRGTEPRPLPPLEDDEDDDDSFSRRRPLRPVMPDAALAPNSEEDPRGLLREHALVAVAKPAAKAKAKAEPKAKTTAKAKPKGGSSVLVAAEESDDDFPRPSSSSGAASAVVVPRPKRGSKREPKVPYPALSGPPDETYLLYDNYCPEFTRAYPNWTMICHHHVDCQRVRGVVPRNCKLGTESYEELPVAFLHAWRETPPEDGKTHRGTDPTPESVREFFRTHSEELLAYLQP